jgi:hypothetical protein
MNGSSAVVSINDHVTAPRCPEQGSSTPTVEDRRTGHTGVSEDRLHAGAAVGERGQRGVAGAAQGVEGVPDQRHDVGAGIHDSAEHLPAALGRLSVADAHLQAPLARVAAADERRVQAEGDRRRWRHGRRLGRPTGSAAQLLAELERAAAQGLVARLGRD